MRILSVLLITALSIISTFAEEKEIRVISLSPAITETVFHLGGGKYLVGRSSACNYPEEAKSLPTAGGFAKPDLEPVAVLNPTLLFTNDMFPSEAGDTLEKLGIRVINRQCKTIDDYRDWVLRIGELLDCKESAANEILRVEQQLAGLKENADSIPAEKRVRVAWIIWNQPLMLAGKGSLPDTIMELTGCINVAAGINEPYFKPSFEWLVIEDPDCIIWVDMPPGMLKVMESSAPWKDLRAVKEKRVIHAIPEDMLLRPGPRLFEGMHLLQKAVYPRLRRVPETRKL